jgi:hypothetical protein
MKVLPLSLILYLASLSSLVILIIGILILHKLNHINLKLNPKLVIPIEVILFFLFLFGVRITVQYFIGQGHLPHPGFRLFPLWLSATLFYPSNFSFRFPQLLGLVILMWLTYRISKHKLGNIPAFLYGLLIGCIPVLWDTANIAEPSIWCAVIWSLLVLRLSITTNIKWIRWFSLLSIATLMRQSAFIGYFPLVTFFIYDHLIGKKTSINKSSFLILSPILLIIPFVLQSFIFGTPATYTPGIVAEIPSDYSTISRVLYAVESGIATKSIIRHIFWPYIFFLILAFIPYSKKLLFNKSVFFLFFCGAFTMFYSIQPTYWGAGRYHAEFIIPFVLLGVYTLYLLITNLFGHKSCVINAIVTLGLIVYNLFNISHLPQMNPKADDFAARSEFFDTRIVSNEYIYNYDDAFQDMKKLGLSDSFCLIGYTYGYFGAILNGYSLAEYSKLNNNYCNSEDCWIESIKKNEKTIQVVLISDIKRDELIQALAKENWEKWKEYINEKWGSSIIALKRKSVNLDI